MDKRRQGSSGNRSGTTAPKKPLNSNRNRVPKTKPSRAQNGNPEAPPGNGSVVPQNSDSLQAASSPPPKKEPEPGPSNSQEQNENYTPKPKELLSHARIHVNGPGPAFIHPRASEPGYPVGPQLLRFAASCVPNRNPNTASALKYAADNAAYSQNKTRNISTSPRQPVQTMGNQGIRQHVETSTKTGVFHLSKAKLHEFPPELAKIVNALRNIDLSENKITLIPQNISAFANLKQLNLNHNQIEVIPDQIGQLSKLETLSLSNNCIKAVPATIAHLQKLRDVNLSSNQLTTFPTVFSSLKYLTVLDLAHNRITEVPDGVGGLQVVELILNQNQVRRVSKDLALCPNLKTLRLQENTLELSGLPMELLKNSPVSLLSVEGNLFDVKQLSDLEGYEQYMERYTTTKKKLM